MPEPAADVLVAVQSRIRRAERTGLQEDVEGSFSLLADEHEGSTAAAAARTSHAQIVIGLRAVVTCSPRTGPAAPASTRATAAGTHGVGTTAAPTAGTGGTTNAPSAVTVHRSWLPPGAAISAAGPTPHAAVPGVLPLAPFPQDPPVPLPFSPTAGPSFPFLSVRAAPPVPSGAA